MHILRAFAVAGILPLLASAHMQMHTPFPINSQEDPAVPDNLKDYDYTSPLSDTGEDFPCKGYHLQATSHVSKATYKAGGAGQLVIKQGGASHGGGSCQVSLSYDNGATWKVIKSMIGGCPTTLAYDFTIPADAPSSNDVLLAWTWFNLVGNREMYMNCARVTVEGSTPGRHRRSQVIRRQNTFDSLPEMYTCNIGGGCKTKEGEAIAFPQPGPDVAKAEGGSAAAAPASSAGSGAGAAGSGPVAGAADPGAAPGACTGSCRGDSGAAAGGAGAPSPAAPAPFANATSTASSPPAGAPTTTGNSVIPIPPSKPVTPANSPPPAPAPAAPAPAAAGSCTSGAIICNTAETWSLCANGAPVFMGAVAAGTACVNGKIGHA